MIFSKNFDFLCIFYHLGETIEGMELAKVCGNTKFSRVSLSEFLQRHHHAVPE